jgi:hypothetical protein
MKLFLGLMLFATMLYAETQEYEGEAFVGSKYVYREKHTLELEAGKVIRSTTVYTDQKGKILAQIKNDYRRSLSVPEHEMEDLVHGGAHGVRYKNSDIVMFNREGKKEETKIVRVEDFRNKLLVGGQGFHYYLMENLEEIIKKGKVDLKFLIPGRLDAYDFYLKVARVSEDTVELEIEIDNWFLRLFAPKLELLYDRKKKRLLKYTGLSNIKNEDKELMKVKISYRYPN